MADMKVKKVRKGTRSCLECRLKKVRCIYANPNDTTCQRCAAHERACRPQVYSRQHDSPRRISNHVSPQARLQELEDRVARIANSTQTINASSSSDDDDDVEAPVDIHGSNQEQAYEGLASSPPTYLRLIFDDSNVSLPDERWQQTGEATSIRSLRRDSRARRHLQRLIPSREDCDILVGMSDVWMHIYHTFFPSLAFSSSLDSFASYDKIVDKEADPIEIAAALISQAMTVLHLTHTNTGGILQSLGSPSRFVKRVIEVARKIIVRDDHYAATPKGIEVILLYLRLQLNRGDIRDMWLTSRRATALTEYLGLHRTVYRKMDYNSNGQPVDYGAAIMTAVCAVDRMLAMMFNLPPATAVYTLPEQQIVDDRGQVILHEYMLRLTAVALGVQQIDEELNKGRTYSEVYQRVLLADSKLRSLQSTVPQEWWAPPGDRLEPRLIPHLMHCYLTFRVHLHSAMRPDDEFAYSWHRCIEAAQTTSKRYQLTRPLLPAGFFLTRLFQIHIFTVTVVLLLSRDRKPPGQENTITHHGENADLINRSIQCLQLDATQSPADFATQAAAALQSLQRWLDTPDTLASEGLTLRVPILGKMVMKRAVTSGMQQTSVTGGMSTLQQESPGGLDLNTANASDATFATREGGKEKPDDLSWLVQLDLDALCDDSLFASTFENL